jgi:hypothetical protein
LVYIDITSSCITLSDHTFVPDLVSTPNVSMKITHKYNIAKKEFRNMAAMGSKRAGDTKSRTTDGDYKTIADPNATYLMPNSVQDRVYTIPQPAPTWVQGSHTALAARSAPAHSEATSSEQPIRASHEPVTAQHEQSRSMPARSRSCRYILPILIAIILLLGTVSYLAWLTGTYSQEVKHLKEKIVRFSTTRVCPPDTGMYQHFVSSVN